MTRLRYFVATGVILFILGASTYDIVRDEEHWPFSQYPMFNRATNSRELVRMRLYGVTQDGQEIALIRYRDVFPFDQSRLSKGLGSLGDRPDASDAFHAVLLNCLGRYERQRLKGWHDGPPLVGLRLYRVSWQLHPQAANVHSPDARELLAELGS